MDKFFKLKENNTNMRTEIIAGITTFLTMAYIIAVNPDILSIAGMPKGALVTATCLTAGLTTIFMGLYANLPFGLASGMGLNAFFTFGVVIGLGVSWQTALTAVFIEGIIFIILSLTNVREAVVNTIPLNLKYAVTVGIGLFISFIGFVNSGVVIKNESTMVSMGNFTSPTVIIAAFGLFTMVVFYKRNIKGALLWGIAVSTIAAWIYAIIDPQGAAYYKIFLPEGVFKYESISSIAFKLDFSIFNDPSKIWTLVVVVFTFLFVDFFDTVGTLVGVASKANMIDKEGKVPGAGKALLVDAIGTTVGALLGVSTVTTYVESSAGVAEGGRTGLTSLVTGGLFLLAMFFAPLFVAIPGSATAPALIMVGFFMMENITKIDFSDFSEGIPAFLTIILMPLTYSIGDGLTIGVLSYVIIGLLVGVYDKGKKKVSNVMICLAFIFIIKLIVSGIG
ncbi:NCS2 family permease [Clostridium hydrogeniformans]|uniref:NCS2 family permease n=1 Tax=Clostridium hydrogeniformans TaxID=349933 RepID=UPI0004817D25|nr:NCS2 family permease [Clostridium hydrogeniformans]